MAPNASKGAVTGVLHEDDAEVMMEALPPLEQKPDNRKLQLVWRNIILFAYLHAAALYGAYLMFFSASVWTGVFAFLNYQMGGLGITAGAHRLWAHKSYKAKWPLRAFLAYCNTLAFQDAVIDWARDHRVHHKYSETDADPHNAKRGFFFAHMGWLLVKKHPEVKRRGKNIDMSDLHADPVLAFQKKHYLTLMPLICFVLPTVIPMYFWNETFLNAFVINLFRYTWTLNATWLVNSAAHMVGHRPYDRHINPSEVKTVSLFALGEGFHNYHHTFPWDYKAAELGRFKLNPTLMFIDFMAKIGQVYDRKTVNVDVIKKRVERTGDGSHELWGWGDKDQSEEERKAATVIKGQ